MGRNINKNGFNAEHMARRFAGLFKSVAGGLTPPYALWFYRRIKSTLFPPPTVEQELQADSLFDGDDKLFKSIVRDSLIYAEFGCGRSTIWSAVNADCKIFSVDTSSEWSKKVVELVREKGFDSRLTIKFVDLGVIGDWGMPLSFDRRSHIHEYVCAPWRSDGQSPDTILIDGRFRIACFLSCLLNAKPGTKIIFDDYLNRKHYHVAEEFCPISDKCGRQALFVVPASLDKSVIKNELLQFMYVRE